MPKPGKARLTSGNVMYPYDQDVFVRIGRVQCGLLRTQKVPGRDELWYGLL
jgi:hypothetical protein